MLRSGDRSMSSIMQTMTAPAQIDDVFSDERRWIQQTLHVVTSSHVSMFSLKHFLRLPRLQQDFGHPSELGMAVKAHP